MNKWWENIAKKRLIRSLHPVITDKDLIRFGPKGDGGYLIPDDLDGISACFSPGVCMTAGFEVDCAEKGIRVHMADASVDHPPSNHKLFEFKKKYLGGSNEGVYMTLRSWIDECERPDDGDYIIQMDIEGAEYDVLNAVDHEILKRFRIIVIEMHSLEDFCRQKRKVVKKLLKNHMCIHIHPNNCSSPVRTPVGDIPPVMEFTFLRKDRIQSKRFAVEFPHQLDCDNTTKPPVALPCCWHR